jgi:hypothetical protein
MKYLATGGYDHPGKADGKPFRIAFTNVAPSLEGSDTWLEPRAP